jgi:hypothetical protein
VMVPCALSHPVLRTKPDTHYMWAQEVKSHIWPQIKKNIKIQCLIYNVLSTKKITLGTHSRKWTPIVGWKLHSTGTQLTGWS